MPGHFRTKLVAAAAGLPLLGALLVALPATTAQAADPGTTIQPLESGGTVNLRQQAAQHPATSDPTPAKTNETRAVREVPEKDAAASPAAAQRVPNPPNTAITNNRDRFFGFEGLSHADQRLADNGNQFSSEPPDQGLCAGTPPGSSGNAPRPPYAIEMTNSALQVFTTDGFLLTPPVSFNAFLGIPPSINRQTFKFGPDTFDPRCYYDNQVNRWFLVFDDLPLNQNTGALTNRAFLFLAVSKTSDPTGDYRILKINTADDGSDGTPRHRGCPCFGDFPTLGADANGIYITTNEFSLNPFGAVQNNAQIYAISKQKLANGTANRVVHIDAGQQDGFPSQTLQPAMSPPGGQFAPNREYFLASNDFSGFSGGDDLFIYALSNTSSLDSSTPNLRLTRDAVPSEPYAGPVKADQRSGPTPLGDILGEPERNLDAGDTRMQQVTYALGKLYSTLDTGIGANNAVNRDGVAWFEVTPSFERGQVGGRVTRQGYIAANNNLLYSSIGINAEGKGLIDVIVSGRDYFPSSAYVEFDARNGGTNGPVHIARLGFRPEDGFTCYRAFVGSGVQRGCRFGDYSAAVAASPTQVMYANEFITDRARTFFANYGTWVGRLSVG